MAGSVHIVMQRIAAVAAWTLALHAGPGLAAGPDSVAMIAQAAERGADTSQVQLAVAYLNGSGGLARDPARAAYWFEQAAIRGNAYAEARLGDLYAQGLGVPENQTVAFDWRIKAARRGDAEAQLKVGRMYQEGIGVGRNMDQAIYWYRRAALEGNAEAQSQAGSFHRYGDDVEVTQASSRSAFERAAMRGYDLVRYFMDLVEDIGYWIEEDWHHRLPGLEKLARDGDAEAAYQLARRYEHGAGGVRQNSATALAWYQRAAEGGHPRALRELARIRSAGDPDKAALAARPGSVPN